MDIFIVFLNFEFNTFVPKFDASYNLCYSRAAQTSEEIQKRKIIPIRATVLYIELGMESIFKL